MNAPKLTKLETEILNHRLEVPDCILDCLEEESDVDLDEAGLAIDKILAGKWDEVDLTPATKAVLKDAVEGSMYYGASKDSISPQMNGRIHRAGRTLAEKIGQLIGEAIYYPRS